MKEKRIGNFVSRECVSFTQSEIDEVVENIKRQFEGNQYGIRFSHCEPDDGDGMHALRIRMAVPRYEGRDCDGARFILKGIHFTLYKKRGELELSFREKMYEPFDGFCYSGDIHFNADWCRYRGRTWESYQKVCPYKYGDEISDLDYSEVLRQLWRDLRGCSRVDK